MPKPTPITKRTLKAKIQDIIEDLKRDTLTANNIQAKSYGELIVRDLITIEKLHDQRTK